MNLIRKILVFNFYILIKFIDLIFNWFDFIIFIKKKMLIINLILNFIS